MSKKFYDEKDEAEETSLLDEEYLTELAFKFLSEIPSGYLGIRNDMVMILDVKIYYYRLLDPSEQQAVNLILVKNMIQDICKKYEENIYEEVASLSDVERNKFSKIVYNEILLNRYFFCKTNLEPKYKNQNRVLLLDGEAPSEMFINLGINGGFDAKKSSRFLSFLNIKTSEIRAKEQSSDFFDFIKALAINDKSIIAKSRNLFLNLITNTPKDNLIFTITSKNERILSLYIKLIEDVFSSEFFSFYSTKELLKKSSWLSLTNKVVNFTSQIDTDIEKKSEMIENLKTLAQSRKVSILKGNKAYNFKNRTILIFYGSPAEVEPIRNVLANQKSTVTISLPDEVNSKWDAPIAEKILYKCRGDLVLFSYYGMKIAQEDEQESNDTASDDESAAVFIDHSADDVKINNIDSFETFFFEHIEITGARKDYILKEDLFEKYEQFIQNSGLQIYNRDNFYKLINKHPYYAENEKDCIDKMKKSSNKQAYFFPARCPTNEQFSLSPNLANKRIYNGIKYIPSKEII